MSLERAQTGFVAALAAACVVSIFAAQACLVLAFLVFLARIARGEARWERTPLDAPVLALVVWTLLSAAFSPDPLASHRHAKQLLLFPILYLAVDTLADRRRRERVLDALLLGAVVLGAEAILQYHVLGFDSLELRPRGLLGHYMTASQMSMGALVLATSRLVHVRRWLAPSRADLVRLSLLALALLALAGLQATDLFAVEGERLLVAALVATAFHLALARGPWPGPATGGFLAALALPVSAWALVLGQTRNAWLGAVLGVAVVALVRAPRLLWVLGAALVALLALRPEPVVRRLTFTDASSLDRYFMWQAGLDMVRDKPVFGQGPGLVEEVYPRYRWPGAPNPRQPHLHDNALQLAAERGLPALAWWLWWMAAATADAWREVRRGAGAPALGALGYLCAHLAAGLFEYNFGDSEVLMLTLLVSALPYALRHPGTAAPRPAAA